MKINTPLRKLFSRVKVSRSKSFTKSLNVDVREEYANAFRTESYLDFWTRVLEFSNGEPASGPLRSTTANRLPSYRLFVDHFLDPDQATIARILTSANTKPKNHALLSDYFSETADASVLCGLLLKDTQRMRAEHRALKTTINVLENVQTSPLKHLPAALARLRRFSKSSNPFVSTAPCSRRLQAVQLGCTRLLKRLERSRNKAQAKLHLINKVKNSSAILLVAFTVSVTIVVVTHVLPLLVAAPALVAVSLDLASTRKLSRQLDTAAKGTYILNRDLDTISRMVDRLNDEIEHMRTGSLFWLDRGEERLQGSGEVARQLRKSSSSFGEQLDELEEHLYLCFMTINRSRKLVVKEIMVHGVTP